MRQEIIIAGFGGQGVLVMGQILTCAGMMEDKQVSWIPSYGPEMRGGTANCSVIISEHPIGSPIVYEPTAAVVMNQQSLDKFEPMVEPCGVLIVNRSLITAEVKRKDIKTYGVAVNDIASELGNSKMANMVALGALIAATGVVKKESLFKAFSQKFAAKPQILKANQEAIESGYTSI